MKKIALLCLVLSVVLALASCMLFSGGTANDKTPEETDTIYTVNFLTIGGSKVNSVEVKKGDTIIQPEDPTKAGYTFVGWYSDSSYEIEWDFDVDVVMSDLRLYAKWETAHTHSYAENVVYPTCTEAGYVTYTCSCGDTYTDSLGDAHGHFYVPKVTEPTCLEGGYTVYTCELCSDSYTDDEIAALGHNYSYETTPPTCTEGGITTKTCRVCGDVVTTNPTEPAGHSYESAVTDPDCENGGYTTHTCETCGHSYVDSNTDALGHTPGKAADCTNPQSCTVCGKKLQDALGHTPGEEATCTEAQSCTVCGETLKSALGHAPAQGQYCHEASVCNRCGTTLETIEHQYADATCQAPKTCTVCGFTVGSIGGHSYVDTVIEPTCTEGGYTKHVCSVCNDTYTDAAVSKLGHTASEAVTENKIDSTCEQDGSYDSVVYCSVCEAELERIKITENKLGHQYGEDGRCTVCGEAHPDLVTVTYVLNGGVNDEENLSSFIRGNEPTLYSPSHPSGYKFGGWYTDPDFKNEIKAFDNVGGEVTVYAKWIKLSNPEHSDGIETPEVPF